MEKLQLRLSSAEASVGELEERVREGGEEVTKLRQERDEFREMTEKSSAELRRALEVEKRGGGRLSVTSLSPRISRTTRRWS